MARASRVVEQRDTTSRTSGAAMVEWSLDCFVTDVGNAPQAAPLYSDRHNYTDGATTQFEQSCNLKLLKDLPVLSCPSGEFQIVFYSYSVWNLLREYKNMSKTRKKMKMFIIT